MKKSRFREEQMVTILREADRRPVPEVAKQHGVSAQTIYSWRKHFGTLEPADVKRLRQLEQENGVGARMRAGLRASNRRARHLPMRHETGLPSSVIRFRTLHASTASRRCPDELRARRQSPTIDVYRKNAFSTRAC